MFADSGVLSIPSNYESSLLIKGDNNQDLIIIIIIYLVHVQVEMQSWMLELLCKLYLSQVTDISGVH